MVVCKFHGVQIMKLMCFLEANFCSLEDTNMLEGNILEG